jgi:hypothetical protein
MNWDKSGYHLKISYWEGRLGNNIQQICCGIFIAEQTKSLLSYPKHEIMEHKVFDFREDKNKIISQQKTIVDTYFNYGNVCGKFLSQYTPEEQRRICEKYLRPLFKSILSSPLSKKYNITNDDLIIHIRSGDNFIRKVPHGLYIQDPWSYYKSILDKHSSKYKRIFLLTEPDKINPTIGMIEDYVQKLNINHAQQFVCNTNDGFVTSMSNIKGDSIEYKEIIDLNTCIYILLNAKNLILSNSSFAQRLCMCNPSIEDIFASSLTLAEKESPKYKFKIHYYKLNNYINFGEWKNTSEQIQKIINHPMNDVIEITDADSPLIQLPPHFAKYIQ